MRALTVTLTVGIAVLVAIAAVVLTQAPPRLVRVSAPGVKAVDSAGARSLETTTGSPTICQAGEVLPAGVSAIRVSIWAFFGAPVRLSAYQGEKLLTDGARGADWTSDSVTVPVRPLPRAHRDVRVCAAIGPNSESLLLMGPQTTRAQAAVKSEGAVSAAQLTASDGTPLPGRLVIEYLAPGRGSWWSRILPTARRFGLGRAYSGTWIALLVAALMAAVGVLAVRSAIKEPQ